MFDGSWSFLYVSLESIAKNFSVGGLKVKYVISNLVNEYSASMLTVRFIRIQWSKVSVRSKQAKRKIAFCNQARY